MAVAALRGRQEGLKMINRTLAALAALSLAVCALAAPSRITAAKAARIAQAKYHGKLLGTPKLEHEDGVWQYVAIVDELGGTPDEGNKLEGLEVTFDWEAEEGVDRS